MRVNNCRHRQGVLCPWACESVWTKYLARDEPDWPRNVLQMSPPPGHVQHCLVRGWAGHRSHHASRCGANHARLPATCGYIQDWRATVQHCTDAILWGLFPVYAHLSLKACCFWGFITRKLDLLEVNWGSAVNLPWFSGLDDLPEVFTCLVAENHSSWYVIHL